jgi:hypothetical protein
VYAVDAVVLGVAVRTRFSCGPALKRWKALAFPTELVDARDAVRMDVARACGRRRGAIGDRGGKRATCALPGATAGTSATTGASVSSGTSATAVTTGTSVSAGTGVSSGTSATAGTSASTAAYATAGARATAAAARSAAVDRRIRGATVQGARRLDSAEVADFAITSESERDERGKPGNLPHAHNLAIGFDAAQPWVRQRRTSATAGS